MTETIETPWLTSRAAAAYLGVSKTSLTKWVRRGFIRVGYAGSHRRFHRDDLDRFVRTRKGPGARARARAGQLIGRMNGGRDGPFDRF